MANRLNQAPDGGAVADSAPRPASGAMTGALAGIRVLDLSRVLAGPLCAQMLADHGADVIKVEPPSGDESRQLGPPFAPRGDAAYFMALNRGKRSISLNLGQEPDRELLHGLLAQADVLVENFLPGTMPRWGLGFERDLAPRYPRLVYCSITGFGDTGPLGGLPGYDAVLQAQCGLMSINGEASAGPTRIGVPIVDHLTAYTALSGILMALLARERTGVAQRVDATLFDTALSLLLPQGANWLYSGQEPQQTGSAHPNIAPYDKFEAGDGLVFLGIVNDGQFRRFCLHLGRPDLLEDVRFQSNASRLEHVAALREEIGSLLRGTDATTLCQGLMAAGVPAAPVHTVKQALAQAHTTHRGMRVATDDYLGIGPTVRLSAMPGPPPRRPPQFDEHRHQIQEEARAGHRSV